MRCPSCASDIPESSRYCPACGVSLESPYSAPTRTVARAADSGEGSADHEARAGRGSPGAVSSSTPGSGGSERFPLGTLLDGRYRIVGLLGRGGMGEVYRADDLKLGRPVALKFLPQGLETEPGRLSRFLNEVRLALRVTHPNVCRVHDIGEADGQHFLSMEYVDGEDLASLLRRIERFPRDRAIRVARQICAGLAAAHEQGILHRDLKPTNIMIDGRGQVKITDFGLAGIADELKGPQARLGTPAYMAPEQLEGREVTVRSDIYALGLVLYELFTGRTAFEGRTPAELARRQRDTTPASPTSLVEGLDPSVGRVILRCLEKDPKLRPASALAVASALPGGDPIAAALAAGETPSPELLAEAGQAGGVPPAFAWAGLAMFLVGMACAVLLAGHAMLVRIAPMRQPPEALAERAREIVRAAGYAEEPADRLSGFLANESYLRHLEKLGPRPDPLAPLRRTRPPALLFWHRQSPKLLEKFSPGSDGDWFTDPPYDVPGMVRVGLDTEGRLQSFTAVPPERSDAREPPAAPDWGPLLSAAGLDPAALRETVPSWSPPVFADHRAAWEGVYPEAPDVPIHVEAASNQSRPVWFRIIEPWTEATTAREHPQSTLSRPQQVVFPLVFVFTLIGATILAVRNLRLGRGDRRTAIRFGLYLGGVRLLWFVGAHHLASPVETYLFICHLAFAMYRFGIVWVFYIALEPYARRLWPEMLVSWVRLFGGRFRDPLVGRDLLVGTVLGVTLPVTSRLGRWVPGLLHQAPFPPETNLWGFESLRGFRHTCAAMAGVHTDSVLGFMIPIVLFLVLRVLTRRTWVGLAIVTGLGGIGFYPGSGSAIVFAGFFLINAVMVWIVLFRFGLLSVLMGMSIADQLTALPVTFDLSAWYAAAGLPSLLVIVALAAWAFRACVAGRPLFRDEILEAEVPVRAAR